MTEAIFLLLGTNLGHRQLNLQHARQLIEDKINEIHRSSSVYETAAWGLQEQPAFLNQVVVVKTDLPPLDLLHELQAIEELMGRMRYKKWAERIIDIDIIYYGNLIYNHPELKIPHPEIANRRFTLVPLAEVAPGFLHPTLKFTSLELLDQCPDQPVNLSETVPVDSK